MNEACTLHLSFWSVAVASAEMAEALRVTKKKWYGESQTEALLNLVFFVLLPRLSVHLMYHSQSPCCSRYLRWGLRWLWWHRQWWPWWNRNGQLRLETIIRGNGRIGGDGRCGGDGWIWWLIRRWWVMGRSEAMMSGSEAMSGGEERMWC